MSARAASAKTPTNPATASSLRVLLVVMCATSNAGNCALPRGSFPPTITYRPYLAAELSAASAGAFPVCCASGAQSRSLSCPARPYLRARAFVLECGIPVAGGRLRAAWPRCEE
jgi:hypothetical protein